jgi:hypothetical protein
MSAIINATGPIAMMGGTSALLAPYFWLDPSEGILLGSALFVSGGGAPPAITLSGTRTLAIGFYLEIQTVTTFRYSVDNGATWVEENITIPAGSTHNCIGAATGLILNFPAGVYATVNVYQGQVESWTDKILGLVFTQATAANRPFYLISGLNGLPCLEFDGSNDQLVCTDVAAYSWLSGAAKTHAYTLFYQASFDVADALNFVFSYANTGSATGFWAWGINLTANGVWMLALNDGGAKNLESSEASAVSPSLFMASSTGTVGSLRVDDLPMTLTGAGAQNPGAVTLNNAAIGVRNRSGADGRLNGKVGHIVQFDSDISTTQKELWTQALRLPTGYAVTLRSSAITLTTDDNHAGSGFVTLSIHGSGNLTNATDNGRGLQASWRINNSTAPTVQSYNPTQQGSQSDGGAQSTSIRLSAVSNLGQTYLRTVTAAAYWLNPGAPGALNTSQPGDGIFDLEVEMNWLGNANIVRWYCLAKCGNFDDHSNLYGVPVEWTIETCTCYTINSVFTVYERWAPSTGVLTTIPPSEMQSTGPTFGNDPIVLSSADNTRAVAWYVIDLSPEPRGYRVIDFALTGGAALSSVDYQWQNTYSPIIPDYTEQLVRCFFVAGTKAEVLTALDLLYDTYGV